MIGRLEVIFLTFLLCLTYEGHVVSGTGIIKSNSIIQLNDTNWEIILGGDSNKDWMIEFFAPWCPACRNLNPIWKQLSESVSNVHFGQVDITTNPYLSGRFIITSLPTIYHVHSGEFRLYKSSRSFESVSSFLSNDKWVEVEPVGWYKSPSSWHMGLVGRVYEVSMGMRNLMTVMTDEWNIPTWGCYLIFIGVTIGIGLTVGMILVLIIDCLYPPPPVIKSKSSLGQNNADDQENEHSENDSVDPEEIVDDDESEAEDEEAAQQVGEDGDGNQLTDEPSEPSATGVTTRRRRGVRLD